MKNKEFAKKLDEMVKAEGIKQLPEEKKNKGILGQAVSVVMYILLGVGGVFAFRWMARDGSLFPFFMPVTFVALYLSMAVQVVVHETGHLVCGLKSGYTFVSYRIGTFVFIKENGKVRVKRYSVKGTKGQCLMVPPEPYSEDMPVVLYNLGGSLANLLLAGISLIGYFLLENPVISSILFVLAISGIMAGFINAVPLRLGVVNNDGYNALEMHRDKGSKWCFWVQLRVVYMLSLGVRLKDMPEEWFAIPEPEKLKYSHWAAVGVFACNRAMDAHDVDLTYSIGKNLLEHADGMVDVYRHYIKGDMLFCELISEAREDEVKRLYSKQTAMFLKAASSNISMLRMLYAYELLYKKDEEAAKKQLAKFEKLAKKHPFPCEVESERELIEIIETRWAEMQSAKAR